MILYCEQYKNFMNIYRNNRCSTEKLGINTDFQKCHKLAVYLSLNRSNISGGGMIFRPPPFVGFC